MVSLSSGGSGEQSTWRDSILSVLKGEKSSSDKQVTVRSLRKLTLLSLQHDESDKSAKKQFKIAVKDLEKDELVAIDSEGMITIVEKEKKRKSKEEKESKKRRKLEEKDVAVQSNETEETPSGDSRNQPCKGNPQGVTRLFLGNLPFSVDEASLSDFLPGVVTHIKWITDKETGRFYGSAFIEMDSSKSAADAVASAGSQLLGRPIKINFAPAREGDVWPPEKKVVSGGSGATSTTGGQAGGKGIKAMGEKPENCVKLFIGNLSYDIDDDGIHKFFAAVDAEVKAVRWLHHQESGDFKGW